MFRIPRRFLNDSSRFLNSDCTSNINSMAAESDSGLVDVDAGCLVEEDVVAYTEKLLQITDPTELRQDQTQSLFTLSQKLLR